MSFFQPITSPAPGTLLPVDEYPKNKKNPSLFQPFKIRSKTIKNRIWISPMCQYSAAPGTGIPSDWHLVHLGSFATRGFGLVMTEATSVAPNGRISAGDLGIWSDEHIPSFKRIADFIHIQGGTAAIQLAHAGRKASTYAPWDASPEATSWVIPKENYGWPDQIVAPSALSFDSLHGEPKALTEHQILEITQQFVDATRRAKAAGFDVIEIHAAHGYLLTNFLSPISNQRNDKWGGSFENRTRLLIDVVKAIRAEWGEENPLFVRISATEYFEDGEKDAQGNWISWGLEQSTLLAKELSGLGVDLVDVSSGGNYAKQLIKSKPGYQVQFAETLEKEGITTAAVGIIVDPLQAEEIVQSGKSHAVFLARESMRHIDFVTDAADKLDVAISVPVQYQRAHTRLYRDTQPTQDVPIPTARKNPL